jgi:hypothetical protein
MPTPSRSGICYASGAAVPPNETMFDARRGIEVLVLPTIALEVVDEELRSERSDTRHIRSLR